MFNKLKKFPWIGAGAVALNFIAVGLCFAPIPFLPQQIMIVVFLAMGLAFNAFSYFENKKLQTSGSINYLFWLQISVASAVLIISSALGFALAMEIMAPVALGLALLSLIILAPSFNERVQKEFADNILSKSHSPHCSPSDISPSHNSVIAPAPVQTQNQKKQTVVLSRKEATKKSDEFVADEKTPLLFAQRPK